MENKIEKHSKKMEDLIIGEILIEPAALTLVIPIIKPECFYQAKCKEIYKAILTLDKKRISIDIVTVVEELERTSKLQSIGGAYEVHKCTNGAIHALHIEDHARIIYQFFVLRELSGVGMKLYNLCNEPQADSLELLQVIQRDLSSINYLGQNKMKTLGDGVIEVLEENRKAITGDVKHGTATGLYNIDRFHTKQKQEFGLIAARPGMGKTVYMLHNAHHTAVVERKPVLIFSLEMSTLKLIGRIMASETKINSKEINGKTLSQEKLTVLGGGVSRLLDAPLYFDDDPFLDVMTLRTKVRRMVAEYGIEEVYIDYIQLMAGEKKGNREQEVSFISRNIKMIAKECDIPIIALSQLSRAVDTRADKKPVLSDLRESGALEQDADWVFFLFRPEYYGVEEGKEKYEAETFDGRYLNVHNLLILDCAKYREGALFKAALKFYGDFTRIENYDNTNSQLTIETELKPIITNNNFLEESDL